MNVIIPEEREFPLEHAEQQILDDLAGMGLTARCLSLGADPCCVRADLFDNRQQRVHGGWGKGQAESARVGALFEAAEHLLAERHATDSAGVMPVQTLLASAPVQEQAALPMALLAEQQDTAIACRMYQPLGGGTAFPYPLALSEPSYFNSILNEDEFDYGALHRYSSSSGTAIGATRAEALLHALNECIERDAISLFMLEHFFHALPLPLRQVLPDGLPADVADLYHAVSRMLGAPVHLLDISTGIGTTCLAVLQKPFEHGRPFGAGTSLNPAHAARRALHELVQYYLAEQCDSGPDEEGPEGAGIRLANWPKLLASARMDIESRLAHGQVTQCVLADRPGGTPQQQIETIQAQLAAQNLRAGVAIVDQRPSGTTVVDVVVPAFERFFLVHVGNVVAPGLRGMALRQLAA